MYIKIFLHFIFSNFNSNYSTSLQVLLHSSKNVMFTILYVVLQIFQIINNFNFFNNYKLNT